MILFNGRVYTEWEHQWNLVDVDGTLTGTVSNAKIVAHSDLYDPSLCQEDVEYFGVVPGAVCQPSASFARLAFNHITPSESLSYTNATVFNTFGTGIVQFHGQGITHIRGWFFLLPTGSVQNIIYFPDFPTITDITYDAQVQDLEVNTNNMQCISMQLVSYFINFTIMIKLNKICSSFCMRNIIQFNIGLTSRSKILQIVNTVLCINFINSLTYR